MLDRVTREELRAFDDRPLVQTLEFLRPNMLRSRGVTPRLAMDGLLLMDIQPLHTLATRDVEQVVWLDGPSATMRYGSRAGGPVLDVTTRRR